MEDNRLYFVVSDYIVRRRKNTVYLLNDAWDDWFRYETQYRVEYIDLNGESKKIGFVKIAEKNQINRRVNLPQKFERLDDNFFSLGASEDYYMVLKDNLSEYRENILTALNDIAYNLKLYESVKSYDVVKSSLLRDITVSTIKGQFHRMSKGGARLTDYSFSYSLPENFGGEDNKIDFKVKAESKPPTNIHAIIGKNGVGKTTILKRMLYAVYDNKYNKEYGGYDNIKFSNVIFTSYSAFDMPVFAEDLRTIRSEIPYTFVGLVDKNEHGEAIVKDQKHLSKDFCDSLFRITESYKSKLWEEIIDTLSSDLTFSELEIKKWISKKEIEDKSNRDNEERKKEFNKLIAEKYTKLSSGHKVILLTLTKLVDLVEEKSLVILDEPEEHLHPPLVSAFIRALSQLLIYRNGVGIIATHSPVIVQELPKKCVWMIRRINSEFIAERPKIQTFGENLGELTSEIFGFEVLKSGFHKLLDEEAHKEKNYEVALDNFGCELGKEARSLLKAYVYKYGEDIEN